MKKLRILATVVSLSLTVAVMSPGIGRAGPDAPAQGVASSWVEHVRFVPFEVYGATGAKLVGHYFYITSWRSISIYDASNPEDPQLVSITPVPSQYENEDVATNGKILVYSQTGNVPIVGPGQNFLHIYDVTDKTKPVEVASVSGLAQHTMTCVADCTYLYGSSGNIIDLHDPTKPALVGNWATLAGVSAGHDVREDAPGIVVVSSGSGANCPGAILDTTDPAHPKKLACMGAGQKTSEYMHSTSWANQATDRFMLVGTETNLTGRCGANGTGNGSTYVYDMTGWQGGTYSRADRWQTRNGYMLDGNTPADGAGCSAHWLEASPSFHNGGIFAQAYYDHGTRFFYVNGNGKLTNVGFFQSFASWASAAHWVTDRVVYVVDYTRGFDVLKWNGPLPRDPAAANGVTSLVASAAGNVSGTAGFAGETAPVVAATDPAGDGALEPTTGAQDGTDLTEASVSQPEAQLPYLQFRWKVSKLPGPDPTVPATAPETFVYTWAFLVNGKQYQVQAKLSNVGSTGTVDDPEGAVTHAGRSFRLRGNCATLVAVNNCSHLAWLDGSFDTASNTITVRVPIGASFAPDIKPGAVISTTQTTGVTTPSIYAAYSAGVTSFGTTVGGQTVGNMADGATWTSYAIPDRTVSLGVAPAGTDPAQVSYSTPAVVAADGSFTGAVGAVPSGSVVFARACFGTSCGFSSVGPS
ncbi:MAG: LVIVD repeat-containing protein [Actinomycetota bacterium]